MGKASNPVVGLKTHKFERKQAATSRSKRISVCFCVQILEITPKSFKGQALPLLEEQKLKASS